MKEKATEMLEREEQCGFLIDFLCLFLLLFVFLFFKLIVLFEFFYYFLNVPLEGMLQG